jgi:hypothetical protein
MQVSSFFVSIVIFVLHVLLWPVINRKAEVEKGAKGHCEPIPFRSGPRLACAREAGEKAHQCRR